MQTVSPANSVRAMKMTAPIKKVGEYCRIRQNNNNVEAIIEEIAADKCKIKTVGYGTEMTIPLKELFPSQGKEARAKQEREAIEVLGGIKWSLKDQCTAPFGDEHEMKHAGTFFRSLFRWSTTFGYVVAIFDG